ncbi:MAG: DUF5606 domain-containing protein [Bacteroidales bacterium]|nr:DUF5606 domain-containing protein [Bacteroidales bacterium]MBO7142180.1 DUF5606 domain-containing protein [Bacteroidales bacterium]
MDLKGILTIATYPGLYKHVAQAVNGIIVESVADGNRTIAFATAKISALEDISIYTTDGDTRLSDVYRSLYKVLDGKPTPFSPKKGAEAEVKELFAKALPNYDVDRVYVSDMRRAYSWYNLLLSKGLVDDKEEQPEAAPEAPAKEEAAKADAPKAEENADGMKTRKRTKKKAASDTAKKEE